MSELLKIYIDFDLLEDGVILTMEYIDAVMASFTGQESPTFGLKVSACVTIGNCFMHVRYQVSIQEKLNYVFSPI